MYIFQFVLLLIPTSSHLSVSPLPNTLIIGYADQCNQKVLESVQQGVNVVIWFAVNLIRDPSSGAPMVQYGLDIDCVASTIKQIRDLNLYTVHMLSIGGWNAPHPDTSNSASAVFKALDRWNRLTIARPNLGFYGFDGFDWDIEGNDDLSSPYNAFTVDCLNLMGEISRLAKQKGYLMSLVPAESYLDPSTSLFDLSLTHPYPEWSFLDPPFDYHAHNVYAFFLAKYGTTTTKSIINKLSVVESVATFDFVTVQWYETYSHADYNLTVLNVSATEYFQKAVSDLVNGWFVDFAAVPALNLDSQIVKVERTALVIGLANGWAGNERALLIYPEEVDLAHAALEAQGLAPRGYAYWNIQCEGLAPTSNPTEQVWMAQGLNEFLHIRNTTAILDSRSLLIGFGWERVRDFH